MSLATEILQDANAEEAPRSYLVSYFSDMHKDAYGVRGRPCESATLADIAEAIADFHNAVADEIRNEVSEEVLHETAVAEAMTSTEWTIGELVAL